MKEYLENEIVIKKYISDDLIRENIMELIKELRRQNKQKEGLIKFLRANIQKLLLNEPKEHI